MDRLAQFNTTNIVCTIEFYRNLDRVDTYELYDFSEMKTAAIKKGDEIIWLPSNKIFFIDALREIGYLDTHTIEWEVRSYGMHDWDLCHIMERSVNCFLNNNAFTFFLGDNTKGSLYNGVYYH